MPAQCEHCREFLSSAKALRAHQASAKYCLEIQKTKGLEVLVSEFKCKCGSVHTKKGNLARHMKVCQAASLIVNGDHAVVSQTINTINNITNNITITPARPFTMQDLTREYIMDRLTPVITKEIVKAGMGAITELVVKVLLKRDGKYCYYCTNPRDKKFEMVIDHDGRIIEEKDPNSQYLRDILSIPLETIVASIAQIHTTKSVQDTYEEVQELSRDGSSFSSTLAKSLPRTLDSLPECMKARIEAEKNDRETIKKLEILRQSAKANVLRKKLLEECPYLA